MHAHGQPPLFVDLDGTLLRTDLLFESALTLLKRQPWILFPMLAWALRGKAHLKAQIAHRVELDWSKLPLNDIFVNYLRGEAENGREIWLATASDVRLATPIAAHTGLFCNVIASDGERNIRGREKLEAILAACPDGVFDYAGNAAADYPIWEKARKAIVVNPDAGVEAGARARCAVADIFEDRPAVLHSWIKAARIYQWVKNLLLGVPLLTAHAYSTDNIVAISLAFVAFGLVASATYILNDLLDLSSDRHHPRKRHRPFAAGDLSIASGLIGNRILLILGLCAAFAVSPTFFVVVCGYLLATLGYSLYLKTYMLIDVFLLAGLYTLRILAGAIAISVPLSSWLLAFSMFIFLSLALLKRASELIDMESQNQEHTKGRDYRRSDASTVISLGAAAGYLSVLVLALYADSHFVASHYRYPQLLWLLCPLVLYWISRLWMKTSRGEMHDDPIVFSLRDRGSWACLAGMTVTVLLAS